MQSKWLEIENSPEYKSAAPDHQERMRNRWTEITGEKIIPQASQTNQTIPTLANIQKPSSDAPDFIPGVQRGLQNLQSSLYGAGALAGSGLKKLGADSVGQSLQDFGMEGYRRNVEEAKQYPKKHSFKDIYTGKTGVGGAIDWAQGTLGELVPSMAEAAIGAAVGSVVGGLGAGTAAGGFAGRTLLKKGIEKSVQQAMKKGVGDLTESQVKKQITKQALKKLGGKAGMGAAVMPMESGGMYADLLESKGIDAPETALMFGALATSLEFAGGNSRLVDTFVDALGKGSTDVVKRTAKELLKNIPEEALQEGGQEVMGILNTVANTDEKFLTADNVEQVIESMAAGAIGGGAGALAQGVFSSQAQEQTDKTPEELELNNRASNILNQDKEGIGQSIKTLTDKIQENQAILNDAQTLEALALEADIKPIELIRQLYRENNDNQSLLNKINTGIAEQQKAQKAEAQAEYDKLSPEEKSIKDIADRLKAQKTDVVVQINKLDEQANVATNQYQKETDPEKKKVIAENIFTLRAEKKRLLEDSQKSYQDKKFTDLRTLEEVQQEKQTLYDNLFGAVNVNKDAQESAKVLETLSDEILTQKGQPYQNRKVLENRIAALPDAELYNVIETKDGFIGIKRVSAPTEASTFTNEQQVEQPEQVAASEQVEQQAPELTITEVKDQLDSNNQQLDVLAEQINNTTDFNEQLTLRQEGAAIYEQNNELQNQLDNYNQEQTQLQQEQYQIPETAENANLNPQFQTTENQAASKPLSLDEVKKLFPNQQVTQDDSGKVSIRLKNGTGITFQNIQQADNNMVQLAIETGQMSKTGKILGMTIGTDVLLDENFADNRTLWHENKHVLDNLGLITKEDDSALNREFNKLRKANKLEFALSTHKDPVQRMIENRANMLAQIMVNRESYRNNSKINAMIQRLVDFFQQMLAFGKQSISGLTHEIESGKIYERQINRQTFQTTKPQSEVTAEKWYSALENVVTGFKQKQATPQQWKGMIKNFPGIKQDELDWVGLNEWLDRQEGKVSKQELIDFIQNNNVQLEEVVYEDSSKELIERQEAAILNMNLISTGYYYAQDPEGNWMPHDPNGNQIYKEDAPQNIQDIIDNSDFETTTFTSTKHSDYQEPGGENYKEIILTIPTKETQITQFPDYLDVKKHRYFDYYTLVSKDTQAPYNMHNGIYDTQEITGTSIEDVKERTIKLLNLPQNIFKRGQGYKSTHWEETNPIAHVRFNERTDVDGNKILFLEEVQSDWHQEGRKKGYQGDNTIEETQNTDEIPNAPFKKSWPLLVMKWMVRYAAENGFDKIAWTTGDQQVDRYGKNNIKAEGMKGFYDKMLPSMINKEFNRGKWGKAKVEVIESNILEDVKISKEEALKAFDDDKMVFLGQKDGTQDLIHPDGLERYKIEEYQGTDITTDMPIKNLALPITERMKSKALREGMPMFKSQEQIDSPEFKQWFGDSKITSNGKPYILYHGTNDSRFLQDQNYPWEFDTSRSINRDSSPLASLGIFLGDESIASAHSGGNLDAIHPFYVRLENPLIIDSDQLERSVTDINSANAFRKRAMELQGHDGIIIKDRGQVIVFDPNQVKSAEQNTGAFSRTNDDVRFQVAEMPKQKVSQATYDKLYNEKNNLAKNIAQQARIKLSEIKLFADKALGSISTRLKNIDPELSQHLRWLDFKTNQKIVDVLETAKPILDQTKSMSPEDKHAWNIARLNSDKGKIEQLAQKYNLTGDLTNLREKLDNIRDEAISVGYDVGYIDEYWPRVIKDQEGFLQATQEISQRPVFSEAIREQAKKLGITQTEFEREFPEIKADIISNLILRQSEGIGGPGNIQSRVYETIPDEYVKYYMDADAALMQYVYSMTKKIEARKFFGKVPQRISELKASKKRKQAELTIYKQAADMAENPEKVTEYEDKIQQLEEDITLIDEPLNNYKINDNNYTENIGAYIDQMRMEGRIEPKDEKTVRDILNARFNEHGTTGIVNAYKNLSYIDTMGNPISAITQIGDLAWAMYVGKVWTPRGLSNTAKNLSRAILKKSNITKEDLGIERIAQEFADGTTLSKGVSKVFRLVGLEQIDSIGKEVLVNNSLANYKAKAKADPDALAKEIKPTFGKHSIDVVRELLAYDPNNPNAVPSDNIKMLLYSRLLDFQPVALSEMPEYYLNSGNGRIFYMLKTYTLKQFDVFRKEVVHNLKSENPQQKLQGITNMVQLMALLTLANATADEIKDFMLGKETKFSDNVIENFLTLGGASRYLKMQVSREGIGSALTQQILPPTKFVNSASRDFVEGYKNYVSGDTSHFDHSRIIDSIPGVGKLYYWHYGRGSDLKKSIAEQEYSKAKKDARLLKKQIENSDDKRVFIEANLDRFKQMKLQENFQAALNKNKAVINKLEKIPSTVNVQTRLGQLKAQREQILKRYQEAAKAI